MAANPWDNDPIVEQTGNPWDNDPVVEPKATEKPSRLKSAVDSIKETAGLAIRQLANVNPVARTIANSSDEEAAKEAPWQSDIREKVVKGAGSIIKPTAEFVEQVTTDPANTAKLYGAGLARAVPTVMSKAIEGYDKAKNYTSALPQKYVDELNAVADERSSARQSGIDQTFDTTIKNAATDLTTSLQAARGDIDGKAAELVKAGYTPKEAQRIAMDSSPTLGSSLAATGAEIIDKASENLSPEGKAADKTVNDAVGPLDTIKAIAQNPRFIPNFVAEQAMNVAPMMLGGIGISSVAEKVAQREALAAVEAAKKSPWYAAAERIGSPVQKAAAADKVQAAGAAAYERVMANAETLGTVTGIGMESGLTAIQTASDLRDKVIGAKEEDLRKNPAYNQILAENNGDVAKSRAVFGEYLAGQWAPVAGASTATGAVVTGGGRALTQAAMGRVKDGVVGGIKNLGKEAGEEVMQGLGEDWAQYKGEVQADPTSTYDPGKSAVLNALGGVGMGAAIQGPGVINSAAKGEIASTVEPEPVKFAGIPIDRIPTKGLMNAAKATAADGDPRAQAIQEELDRRSGAIQVDQTALTGAVGDLVGEPTEQTTLTNEAQPAQEAQDAATETDPVRPMSDPVAALGNVFGAQYVRHSAAEIPPLPGERGAATKARRQEAELVEKLFGQAGLQVNFVTAADGGVRFGGAKLPGLSGHVFVDLNDRNFGGAALRVLAGHEAWHDLRERDPALYQKIVEALAPEANLLGKDQLQPIYDPTGNIQLKDNDHATEEQISNLFGNVLHDPAKVRELLDRLTPAESKTFVQRVLAAIARIKQHIKELGGKYNTKAYEGNLAQVEKILMDGYVEFAKKNGPRAVEEAKAMQRTPAELLLQKGTHPDEMVRDISSAELKRREEDHAWMIHRNGQPMTAMQQAGRKAGLFSPTKGKTNESQAPEAEQTKAQGQEQQAPSAGVKKPGSDLGHKRTRSGEYVGAPPGMTSAKLGAMRNRLRSLIEEGKEGKHWYEESSQAILAAAEGDPVLAEKISGLLAIYSQNATVSGNTTMGFKALYQWMNGEKIKVRFPDQDTRAQEWMDGTMATEEAHKIKTGHFHVNLMRKIDEENYGFDKQGATIDMWMARAFGYGTKAVGSDARYYFAEREIKALAKELGWEPQQVQAAIWISIKARIDAIRDEAREIGKKRGWLKEVRKNGSIGWEPKNGEMRELYEGLIFKMAMKADESAAKEFLHKGVYNFATAIKERVGQISWEAMPGKTTGVLPGIFEAPLEQQLEYLLAIDKALRDENGNDLIAKKLGLPVINTAFGPSAWQMNVGAGAQTEVVVSTDRDQKTKKVAVNQNVKDLLNVYAAIRGYVLAQEAVVWHFPIFTATKANANGVQLDFGRDPSHDEVVSLYNAIHEISGREDWAPAYVPCVGVRVLNFAEPQFDKEKNDWSYYDKNGTEHRAGTKEELIPLAKADGVDNQTFHKVVKQAASKLPETLKIHFDTFGSDGDYVGNDWEASPNGDDYRQRIGGSGRSDLQGWVESELRPRAERINQEFADKYGWGKAKFSPTRSDAAGSVEIGTPVEREAEGARPGSVRATGIHYSKQQRQSLDSSFFGLGLKGDELARVQNATDRRIKQRIYFYVNNGKGIKPEAGVGSHAHRYELSNLYDFDSDPADLFAKYGRDLNGFESAVLDAGYDGYVGDDVAILLGKRSIQPEYVGQWINPEVDQRGKATPSAFGALQRKVMANRSLPGGEMSGRDWKRMMPVLMPEVDVSHLDDETKYYRDQLVKRPTAEALYSPPATIDVDGKQRPAYNHLGQPIYNTEEGIRNFWRWVDGADEQRLGRATGKGGNSAGHAGSAERNPFIATMFFDRLGRPRLFYHGTRSDFTAFDFGHAGRKDKGWLGRAAYATSDPEVAHGYSQLKRGPDAPNIMPVYVAVHNPLIADRETKLLFRKYPKEAIDRWTDEMIRRGYDSVVMESGDGHIEVAVFNNKAIKSAVGNNGNFSIDNEDLRFSPANGFQLPAWTKADTAQERLQDRYNRIRDVLKAVQEQGGTVNDLNDFSMGEDRFHGVASAKVEDIQEKLRDLLKDAKAAGVSMEEVALFAYAEHAPERNARMQAKNKNVQTGSGMSDAEAAAIIAKAKQEGKDQALENLTAKLRKIARETLDAQLRDGLITPQEHGVLVNQYQKWVPLRGFETIDEEGKTFRGSGKGFNVRGKENLRALGRDSKAGQIVENVIMDAEREAIRGTKNTEVNHRFLRFVIDNPDAKLWEIDKVKTQQAIKANGKVGTTTLIDKGDNTIGIKVRGIPMYVKIHDQHLFEQLAHAWEGDAFGPIPFLGDINRFFSRSFTAWSPEFALLTNPARDFTAALMSITGREGIGMTGKFLKNYLPAVWASVKDEAFGKKNPTYEEYRRMGGKTGFYELHTLEQKVADIQTMVKDMQGSNLRTAWRVPFKALRKVEDFVSMWSASLENATRLASYEAMKDAGYSKEKAAEFAHNLNVNFNRRGTWTAGIGSIFLFFNPAVQGTHNMYHTLVHGKHKAQVWALLTSSAAAMFAMAMANAGMGDDDDGIPYWDKIPLWEKERNIIFVLPPYMKTIGEQIPDSTGRYIKIPLPYGWNTPLFMATMAADVHRHMENPAMGMSPGKAAVATAASLWQGFSPISGLPPMFAPVYQHLANKRPIGEGQLYPSNEFNKHKPDSEKYSASMKGTAWQQWAAYVNSVTGGNAFKEGAISLPPAVWRNYVRTLTGGPGSFAVATNDAIGERDITKAPFVRKLYGEISTSEDAFKYYEVSGEAEKAYKQFQAAAKADPAIAREMMAQERTMIELGKAAEMYGKEFGKLSKRDAAIKERKDMTEKEKEMALKMNEKLKSDLQEKFLGTWKKKVEAMPTK